MGVSQHARRCPLWVKRRQGHRKEHTAGENSRADLGVPQLLISHGTPADPRRIYELHRQQEAGICHELHEGGNSKKAYYNTQSLITDGFIDVNEKYEKQRTIENLIHVAVCSNSLKLLKIAYHDRRRSVTLWRGMASYWSGLSGLQKGHVRCNLGRPLWANSGLMHRSKKNCYSITSSARFWTD